mmetsp:Transcript_69/g.186  ORF Transcript_69/g.186 Transcript_69/m.186 type:complete len:240 (-) Transcript_69:477-1196(-)
MASSSERERLWAAVTHEERNSPARAQKHLRWTMRGPFSSYSCLETHMGGITPSEPRIEAPSHAACSRPSSAVTLAGESCGAYRVSSADSRSGSPGKVDVPPASTTCPYQAPVPSLPCTVDSSTPSRSRARMQSATSSASPPEVPPTREGSKSGSAMAARAEAETSMLRPSGSSKEQGASAAPPAAAETAPTARLAASALSAGREAGSSTVAACAVSCWPATLPRSMVRGSGRPSCSSTA